MQNTKNKDQDNAISINDDCGNEFEPLSLDDTNTANCLPETLLPILEHIRSSDVIPSQHALQSSKRPFPSNDTQLVDCNNRLVDPKKHRKQRFWMIVRVLMRYLEKKKPDLYSKARSTLGECAKRHVLKDEGFTSLTQCAQRELKQTVGTRDWERAERHVANHLVTMDAMKETKHRKHQFWMTVRVLMKYLEKKDSELYKKARSTLEDCEKRNVMKEERFTNLVESVQRELTQVVGMTYWKRTERHVSKHEKTKRPNFVATVKGGSSFGMSNINQGDKQKDAFDHQDQQDCNTRGSISGESLLPRSHRTDNRMSSDHLYSLASSPPLSGELLLSRSSSTEL